MRNRCKQNRRGNLVVVAAVGLVAIFGVVALALDGGVLQDNRRHVQAAADAAAMAAATELFRNYPYNEGVDVDDAAKNDAIAAAAANGYSSPESTVDVYIPPVSGNHVGEAGYVEVVIEYTQHSYFGSMFGQDNLVVRARAVARGRWIKQNNGIIVLDPHAKGALNAHGSGTLNVNGADVLVNSDHTEAAIGSGSALLSAPNFMIQGGVNDLSLFLGTVETGVPPTPDPLRFLPVPDPSQMTVQSTSRFQKSGGTHNLLPGVYIGGIKTTSNASLNLAPGIYYIDGGGFEFKGQGTLYGEGVMIYNAPSSSNDGVYIAGGAEVTLSPPDSGIYKGITFFQDRTADVKAVVEGSGLYNITGTFYAAGALVQVDGNSDTSIGAQYISRMLDIGGNGDVNITWDTSLTAPLRQINLVE